MRREQEQEQEERGESTNLEIPGKHDAHTPYRHSGHLASSPRRLCAIAPIVASKGEAYRSVHHLEDAQGETAETTKRQARAARDRRNIQQEESKGEEESNQKSSGGKPQRQSSRGLTEAGVQRHNCVYVCVCVWRTSSFTQSSLNTD